MKPTRRRRYVLAGVVVALAVVTASILLEVLGTILFAITVAYVLVPVHHWFVRRGVSERLAGLAATAVGFVGVIAVFSPVVATVYFRREALVDLIRQLPGEVTVTAFDTTVTVEAADVQSMAVAAVRDLGGDVATAAPQLAVKFAMFVVLLFGLIVRGEAAARAALAPVPREYRDVAQALANRASEALYAIYVLQLATAAMTFVVAYPFFWMLDFEGAFLLAMIAAILQFIPIIGPSLLVAPIAIYHLAIGDLTMAAVVGVVGLLLIAWLPDITVRPRLAESTAGISGSLYFVGFTGGLFTLGAIGIVVGPLIVAVFVEAVDLLSAEINADDPDVRALLGDSSSTAGSTTNSSAAEPTADPGPAEAAVAADSDSNADIGAADEAAAGTTTFDEGDAH